MNKVDEVRSDEVPARVAQFWPTVGSVDGPMIPVFSGEDLVELLGDVAVEVEV